MKFKFPIILKIGLLGVLISSIAGGVALTISNVTQRKEAEKSLISNIDKALSVVEYNYTEDTDSQSLLDSLNEIISYIDTIYQDPDVINKTQSDFASFEEYETYFKDKAVWVFPPEGAIIASPAFLRFRSAYRELTHLLVEARLASGARAAYISVNRQYEGENRFVFLNDSRITNNTTGKKYYHLPCSHYTLKKGDFIIDKKSEEYYGYHIAGYNTRYFPITLPNTLPEPTVLAYFFLEYDLTGINAAGRANLLSEMLILGLVLAGSIIVYMVLAYFFITRNLLKLTKVSRDISDNLKHKKGLTPTKFKYKSHDEIAYLAEAINVMEEEIINYTEIIKKEAKENERRAAELEVASNIQLSALPARSYYDDNVSLEAFIKPAKVVGGDFYDYFYNKDEFVTIIADVSGKGIPASLFMMKAKALIKSKIVSGLSLLDAVKEANNELVANNDELLFVTAFIASFNFKKGELRYVSAGHERPYIISKDKIFKLEGESNYVLGAEENLEFKEESIKFNEGDIFFTYTDGLNESINKAKEEFGYERILSTLKEGKDLSKEEIINLMNTKLKEFVDKEEQFDDITMLLVSENNASLHLSYDTKDYSIIEDSTNKFLASFSYLSSETKAHVSIAIDELLNNYISYEKKEKLNITLDFKYSNNELEVIISANGEDYDPFKNHKDKTYKKEDEELTPGGFGLKIIKNISKSQKYHYKDGRSYITLIF